MFKQTFSEIWFQNPGSTYLHAKKSKTEFTSPQTHRSLEKVSLFSTAYKFSSGKERVEVNSSLFSQLFAFHEKDTRANTSIHQSRLSKLLNSKKKSL